MYSKRPIENISRKKGYYSSLFGSARYNITQMGRRRIQIKLIKNERLRNITYNKRKRGLLKKLVELSIMCGIKAKLEMKDSFGNLIVVDAGHRPELDPENQKDKVFVFTNADYPEFKGFQKMKRRGNIEDSEEASIKEISEPDIKPVPEKISGFRQFKPSQLELKVQKQPLEMQPIENAPTLMNQVPIQVADAGFANPQVDIINHLQIQSQLLDYATMRYYSLLNSFMNGQNF